MISPYQFAAFRIIFGMYLTIHFVGLFPYAAELFSREGVLPDPRLNLTFAYFPSPFHFWDSGAFARFFVGALAALSLAFTIGFARPAAAFLLWFGWAALFNRNNLIANPSIPYVGFLLLACALIPAGEPFSFRARRNDWRLPDALFRAAWFLLAAGYTISGLAKLSSPSWLDGTAMAHIVNNPLARPGFVRDLFNALDLSAIATWSSLALEISFFFLCIHSRLRFFAWTAMIGMHLGILLMIDFADLTLGMLMIHLFTFDPRWFPARNGKNIVLYDGVCGFCSRSVQFFSKEDRAKSLLFAPLQGETAAELRLRHGFADDLDTIIYIRNEKAFQRSAAVFAILHDLGGFWRVCSWLRLIPRPIRDFGYRILAAHRYRWFGKLDTCPLPDPEIRSRFLP